MQDNCTLDNYTLIKWTWWFYPSYLYCERLYIEFLHSRCLLSGQLHSSNLHSGSLHYGCLNPKLLNPERLHLDIWRFDKKTGVQMPIIVNSRVQILWFYLAKTIVLHSFDSIFPYFLRSLIESELGRKSNPIILSLPILWKVANFSGLLVHHTKVWWEWKQLNNRTTKSFSNFINFFCNVCIAVNRS